MELQDQREQHTSKWRQRQYSWKGHEHESGKVCWTTGGKPWNKTRKSHVPGELNLSWVSKNHKGLYRGKKVGRRRQTGNWKPRTVRLRGATKVKADEEGDRESLDCDIRYGDLLELQREEKEWKMSFKVSTEESGHIGSSVISIAGHLMGSGWETVGQLRWSRHFVSLYVLGEGWDEVSPCSPGGPVSGHFV